MKLWREYKVPFYPEVFLNTNNSLQKIVIISKTSFNFGMAEVVVSRDIAQVSYAANIVIKTTRKIKDM
jgi:hypothetical protein